MAVKEPNIWSVEYSDSDKFDWLSNSRALRQQVGSSLVLQIIRRLAVYIPPTRLFCINTITCGDDEYVCGRELSGTLPQTLALLPSLRQLLINSARMSGTLPGVGGCQTLSLANNYFYGTTDNLQEAQELQTLILSGTFI